MANSLFDADNTFASSPLRLILLVCGHLITQGFGAIRLYSYIKEGLGALRVGMYCEMPERGRNDERLAHNAFLVGSFRSFQRSDWHDNLNDWAERGLSIAQAAKNFARMYCKQLDGCHCLPDPSYIDWYAGLLRICNNDGFPITEEPRLPGFGPHKDMVEIFFARTDQDQTLYPRPPGFAETLFPYREAEARAAKESGEGEKARLAANYAEWQRRVAEIVRRTR